MLPHCLTQDKRLRSVVTISDLHVGNENAVAPIWGIKRAKHEWKKPLMRDLNKAWFYCLSQLAKKEVDLLIVNGDAIDGSNFKDEGAEVWTPSMIEQTDAAVELIRNIKYKNVIVTVGSGYHVRRGADNFEEILAERLSRYETDGELGEYLRTKELPKHYHEQDGYTHVDAKPYKYTDHKWRFKALNEIFSVTHHVGYSKVEFYRSTPLAREMVTTELDAGKYLPNERPTILLRAHAHYYCRLEFAGSNGIITGSFKLPDTYLLRQGIGGTMPTIAISEILLHPKWETIFRKIVANGINYPQEPLLDATPLLWKSNKKAKK